MKDNKKKKKRNPNMCGVAKSVRFFEDEEGDCSDGASSRGSSPVKGSSKTTSGSKGSKSMATKSPSKNGTPTKASSKSGTPVKARSQKSPSPTKKAPLKSQPQSQTRQQVSGPELIQYPVTNDGQNGSFTQPHDNLSMEISWK
ncbi:hypothetical protein CGCF415_v013816 [Colletotrichum fructicola]|uniref:Uncharacterized protein n=1 Tax=Colletotrichum fructicola (strain Nara gc5) TaxID=1213859 RepID=L2FUZ6_COLFN|nr:uncharacterized protein CGMCC3_g17136 [Colletotrichum fructicola]KAF4485397.1 hypothetical protein CGGC5_v008047 [Colletotrichum fructicola Nara gc5]KAJ0383997.1 hypothetical protein COL922a_009293 [Colletotrichum nupharicola]KAE9566735.1 hypothetical protein CGMCC3_g17136 [Colletotrichum fructicola]KAF4421649.1 hypothetical protein CFRS1_v013994 [Colletotrichum fructicola]KAF4881508.1 hypothetical protein CGCFRS4_v015482 [Colletotrichum fructicola]